MSGFLAIAGTLLWVFAGATPDPVEVWTYEKLFRRSHLVVVASVSETRVVKEAAESNGIVSFADLDQVAKVMKGMVEKPPHRSAMVLQQLETTFHVESVSKGCVRGSSLVMVHTNWKRHDEHSYLTRAIATLGSEPSFVPLRAGLAEQKNRCVLFLTRRPDGKYEAATGQRNSRMSVGWCLDSTSDRFNAAQDKRVHVSFQDTPWRAVIEWLAEQADLALTESDDLPLGTFNWNGDKPYSVLEAIDLVNGMLLTKGYILIWRNRQLTILNLNRLARNDSNYRPDSVSIGLQNVTADQVMAVARVLLGIGEERRHGVGICISTDLTGTRLFATGEKESIDMLLAVVREMDPQMHSRRVSNDPRRIPPRSRRLAWLRRVIRCRRF